MAKLIQIPASFSEIRHKHVNSILNILNAEAIGEEEIKIEYPNFVKPYMISIIRTFLRQNPGVKIVEYTAIEKVMNYLQEIRAHPLLSLAAKRRRSMFSYKETSDSIYDEFGEYLEKAGIKIPDAIVANIGELCENAMEHAFDDHLDAYFGIVAQYYPNVKKLEVCVSDAGQGISKRMHTYLDSLKGLRSFADTEKTVFEYAFQKGSTTRLKGVGGNGLPGIIDELGRRKIKLVVMTNNYYYDIVPTGFKAAKLSHYFKGTLIHLTFEI